MSRLALAAVVAGWLPMPIAAQSPGGLPPGDDAIVTRVVSGDTIEVKIQGIGFTIGYLGIDAPNPAAGKAKAECYSREALNANALLARGQTVRVERESTDFEPSGTGRLMRYVYLQDGRMVNEALLQGGYARADNTHPDRRYRDRLAAAEQSARAAQAGLWGSCAAAAAAAAASATAVAPAVSQPTGPCASVNTDALNPKPDVLKSWPAGGCVVVTFQYYKSGVSTSGVYVWMPAGSRLRFDADTIVFWPDGLVSLFANPNGLPKAATAVVIGGPAPGWPRSSPNGPRVDPKGKLHPYNNLLSYVMEEREVERAGDGGRMLAFPGGRTYFAEDVGNGEYIVLIDALVRQSGAFEKLYHMQQ